MPPLNTRSPYPLEWKDCTGLLKNRTVISWDGTAEARYVAKRGLAQLVLNLGLVKLGDEGAVARQIEGYLSHLASMCSPQEKPGDAAGS